MRRPSPLPPSEASIADAAADAPPAAGVPVSLETEDPAPAAPATARGRAGDGEADGTPPEDGPTAPVIPITSPLNVQRPSAWGTTDPTRGSGSAPGKDPMPAAGIDTAASRVGIRQVWRAARARRRALRAEVRRFTVRQRHRRAVWVGAAASVVVLILATLGAAYSPLFAVETIDVEGASQLDPDAVEAALADQLGTPMPLVDQSAVKAALVTFPLVESYTLEARPPHVLVVRIVERTPVGLIKTPAGYTLVDAAGVVLSTTPAPIAGRPLLTIKGGTGSSAFTAVGQVMRSLPETIRAQVTAVAASTPDDVTLTLGGTNTEVVWGSAEDSALKAVVLQSTMAARPPASVSVYDVSSPRAVVVS